MYVVYFGCCQDVGTRSKKTSLLDTGLLSFEHYVIGMIVSTHAEIMLSFSTLIC